MECAIHHAARRRMFQSYLNVESHFSVKSILSTKDYESAKVVINFLHMTGLYARI